MVAQRTHNIQVLKRTRPIAIIMPAVLSFKTKIEGCAICSFGATAVVRLRK
jgi:hypothetical protein